MDQTPYQPTDRRPIAARGWTIWQRTATWLASRGVSANAISFAGMVCGILAGASFAATTCFDAEIHSILERISWFAAALFIQLRLLANLLDGMVAIESGKASRVGELFNEIPDRISDAATLIGAGYAAEQVVLGLAAACMAIFTAYVRAIGKAAGAANEYCGPMAKQQRMALMTVVAIWCGIGLASPVLRIGAYQNGHPVGIALILIIVGCVVTVIRRLGRISATLKKGAS